MKLLVLALLGALLVGGCTTVSTITPPPVQPTPAPVVVAPVAEPEPTPVVEPVAPQLPLPPAPVVEVAPTPAPATPASTLLASVDAALAANDLARASALCERALRISPRDALLWYRLADIHLRQQRWQEAVANAQRGLLYVGSNASLKAQLEAALAVGKAKGS
jgi:hypothetical protein